MQMEDHHDSAQPNSQTPDVDPFADVDTSGASSCTLAAEEEAVNIAKAALTRIGDCYCFTGPLLEAIAIGAQGPAKFATSWGPIGLTPDPYKHEAYVTAIKANLHEACGWLLALLDAAGAVVVVSPGVFCFMVSHLGSAAFDIPQLLPLTRLTPWAEAGETMH